MGDDSSGEGLFQSLDPARQEEFNGYLEAHEKGLTRHASSVLLRSGMFQIGQEVQEAARCCVQEAYIKLLEAMCHKKRPFSADSGGPQHVKNWLYMVTERVAVMTLRATHPLPQVPLDILCDVQGADAPTDDPLVDIAHMNELIARLDPLKRAIIDLCRQGYRSKEIAARLGMSDGAVRQQLSRALEKLQKWHNSD